MQPSNQAQGAHPQLMHTCPSSGGEEQFSAAIGPFPQSLIPVPVPQNLPPSNFCELDHADPNPRRCCTAFQQARPSRSFSLPTTLKQLFWTKHLHSSMSTARSDAPSAFTEKSSVHPHNLVQPVPTKNPVTLAIADRLIHLLRRKRMYNP